MREDRRRFLKFVGISGVMAGVSGAARSFAAAGKHSPAGTSRPAAKHPAATPPAPPDAGAGAPKGPSAEARALAEVVRRRYPHLGDADLETITSDLDDRLDSGRALRKLTLGNGDEPDATFHA